MHFDENLILDDQPKPTIHWGIYAVPVSVSSTEATLCKTPISSVVSVPRFDCANKTAHEIVLH
jgi:hypothetical protein